LVWYLFGFVFIKGQDPPRAAHFGC